MTARVTSADVAREAGVSRATVSYVLNDRPGRSIPEATRERVRAAAARLDYVPDQRARALRGAPPPVILLVTAPVPTGRNLGLIGDTLTALAAEREHSLVTLQSADPEAVGRTVAHLRPRLLITLVGGGEHAALARRLGVPVVDAHDLGTGSAEGGEAARAQVHHLLGAGRRRIAYLGAADPELARFETARREGLAAATEAAGLPPAPREAVTTRQALEDDGAVRAALRSWRAADPPVDAVACYNDLWAAAVLRAARAEELRVPEDLAVIGMDDEPLGVFLDPPLTTLSLDPVGAAEALFARGLALLGDEDADPSAGPRLRVVVRGSA